MVCIYCSGQTRVTNSRLQKKANSVWRRRKCDACQAIFTTTESVDTLSSLLVKHTTSLEPFSRDKLLLSVYGSLRHRKTALADATALTQTIWNQLYPKVKDATIMKSDIVRTTATTLGRFDKAAATSYTAFHPLI